MSRTTFFAIGMAASFTALPALADWYVNKDIVNTSGVAGAAGIKVEFEGATGVTDTYDGYSDGHFDGQSEGVSTDGNTTLEWNNLDDADGNGVVDAGQLVHIGWTVEDNVPIKDMYFVDADGNPIPGGKIENTTPLIELREFGTGLTFPSNSNGIININNIQIIPFGDGQLVSPFALDDLNIFNPDLNSQLVPWFPGFTLMPGQHFTVELPWRLPPGQPLVVRAAMTGPLSSTFAVDSMQFIAAPVPSCPQPGCEQADVTGDCRVDLGDLSVVLGQFGALGTNLPGDANRDGRVDIADLAIVLGQFGRVCL
jgi:hypothetical protein